MSEPRPEETSPVSPKLRHAMGLISALCDDRITPEQFAELETLLRDDVEVGRFYVSVMHLHAALRHFAFYLAQPLLDEAAVGDLSGDHRDGAPSLGMDETMMLPAMPEPAISDAGREGEIYQPRSVLSEGSETKKRDPLPPYLKGGIAAILLLGVGIVAYVLFGSRGKNPSLNNIPKRPTVVAVAPPPISIATVERSAKAIWDSGNAPADGIFAAGQVLSLGSGDVQLSLHRGGQMVVEGPAEIEFESDSVISLHRGKLVATVPGGGLVIACPSGSVTDLGTEFAVAVDRHGQTEVAVFKGRVSAALASDATTQGTQLLLSVGQAAVMTDKTLARSPEGAVPQRFVCNLVNGTVTSLDVTDLISGGDGTTHRRGIGINPNTGEIGAIPPVAEIVSDGKYHRVAGYPVIDGTFVPDGSRDRMEVDSAGHQFSFPAAGNSAYNNIYTGGKIPWPIPAGISTMLGGVDYSAPNHAIISIHPNNAVTLDLQAIRRIYPDRALVNFHCLVGNTSAVDRTRPPPVAAVYVLVDGMARYQEQHFTNQAGSVAIQFPIQPQDRFLTLITTDARVKDLIDWILWMDAKIDLSAQQ
jgi:hypothetical protein